MKQLLGKIMMFLACAIILVHASIPHHHHDTYCTSGFVFENELTCQSCGNELCNCINDGELCCHEHNDQSHHPFNRCKLQDLLSQLVLNNDEEKLMQFTLRPNLIPILLFGYQFPLDGAIINQEPVGVGYFTWIEDRRVSLTGVNFASSFSHRGPPHIA